jgi:hypothetical protein
MRAPNRAPLGLGAARFCPQLYYYKASMARVVIPPLTAAVLQHASATRLLSTPAASTPTVGAVGAWRYLVPTAGQVQHAQPSVPAGSPSVGVADG